jgi:hypothetical protein
MSAQTRGMPACVLHSLDVDLHVPMCGCVVSWSCTDAGTCLSVMHTLLNLLLTCGHWSSLVRLYAGLAPALMLAAQLACPAFARQAL